MESTKGIDCTVAWLKALCSVTVHVWNVSRHNLQAGMVANTQLEAMQERVVRDLGWPRINSRDRVIYPQMIKHKKL